MCRNRSSRAVNLVKLLFGGSHFGNRQTVAGENLKCQAEMSRVRSDILPLHSELQVACPQPVSCQTMTTGLCRGIGKSCSLKLCLPDVAIGSLKNFNLDVTLAVPLPTKQFLFHAGYFCKKLTRDPSPENLISI